VINQFKGTQHARALTSRREPALPMPKIPSAQVRRLGRIRGEVRRVIASEDVQT
jgi:hypothetical protein